MVPLPPQQSPIHMQERCWQLTLCIGNSGSCHCWSVLARERQVCGSVSRHQNSMFKAIVPSVAFIYVPHANVQSGRDKKAIGRPLPFRLGAAFKSRAPMGPTCCAPGLEPFPTGLI